MRVTDDVDDEEDAAQQTWHCAGGALRAPYGRWVNYITLSLGSRQALPVGRRRIEDLYLQEAAL